MRSFPFLALALTTSAALAQPKSEVPDFEVRPGFEVTLAAQGIKNLRFMEFDDKGTLYVSQPNLGSITTFRDTNQDGKYEEIATFTAGKPRLHGMDFADGWLWYTQSDAIWKGRDTNGDGKVDDETKVLSDLPSGGGHWWRSIAVGQNVLYTSVGDSGNISEPGDSERQKIWRYNLDGSGKTLFSTGIRNTEKLRFRPGTQDIWGADHGSDWYGRPLGDQNGNQPITDLIPPCEFNHYVEGGFYGHPYIVGNGMPRLEFKDRTDLNLQDLVKQNILPAWQLGAHWAPNGWTFAEKDALGAKGDAFIACHGSWNSSTPVGYRVERIFFDQITGKPYGAQPVVVTLGAQGPNGRRRVLDRPVDCVEAPDGSILFSADSGNIYRIRRTSNTR